MRTLRFLVPISIFLVLIAFLTVGLNLDPREVPSPLINRSAPDFQLPDLLKSGSEFSSSAVQGEVWLFNVWASWCVACRDEHMHLQALESKKLVQLIGLNYKDKAEDAILWLNTFGNPYSRIAVDLVGDVAIDWVVYGVPETFVIDSDGMIRYKHIGPINQNVLDNEILPLLRRIRLKASG